MSRKLKAEIEKVEQEINELEGYLVRIEHGDTAEKIRSEVGVLENVVRRMSAAMPQSDGPKPERKKRTPSVRKPNGKGKEATA